MITYIHAMSTFYLLNYVDDFLGIEYASKIQQSHQTLITTLRQLGISRSEAKSIPLTQIIEFIGNLVDAHTFTIGVTASRKVEVMRELNKWRFKVQTNRREMETLVGKLQFISNCIKPGRLFVSRLLAELKAMNRSCSYEVTAQARKDIMWWYYFLPEFSGTAIMWLIDVEEVNQEIATDSCLVAAGGVCGEEYFRVEFPMYLLNKGYKIAHLELWAIIIGVRMWGPQLMGKYVRMFTDNEAVSIIVNTGHSYDIKLQQLLRELTWWLSVYQVRIKTVHLLGVDNKLLDLLSRWHEGSHIREQFNALTVGKNMRRKHVNMDWFNFQHNGK